VAAPHVQLSHVHELHEHLGFVHLFVIVFGNSASSL
jgi:hypothetical protein